VQRCVQNRYLGCIGGRTVADTTRRVMRHAFGLGLARQLNFADRGEKTGIGGIIVTAVIVRKFNFGIFNNGYVGVLYPRLNRS